MNDVNTNNRPSQIVILHATTAIANAPALGTFPIIQHIHLLCLLSISNSTQDYKLSLEDYIKHPAIAPLTK